MPRSETEPNASRPAPSTGLFSPACAACSKDGLRTVSSKYSGANAGFCPSCGVFVCFDCAKDVGFWGWKQTCPVCGKRLRTNSLFVYGAYFGVVLAIANVFLARFDFATTTCFTALLLTVFGISFWVLLNRYSSHRVRIRDFRTRKRARLSRPASGSVEIEEPLKPGLDEEPLTVYPESESTIEELEKRYGPER